MDKHIHFFIFYFKTKLRVIIMFYYEINLNKIIIWYLVFESICNQNRLKLLFRLFFFYFQIFH